MGTSGDVAFLRMRAAMLMKQLAQEFPELESDVLVRAAVEALLHTLSPDQRARVVGQLRDA